MDLTLPLSSESIIILSLATVLVVAILVIFVINKDRRSARKDYASVRAELEQVRRRATTLQSNTLSPDDHKYRYLSEFESDKIYTLLACDDLILDGKSIHYGVVREENGESYPFLTHQAIQLIEVEGTFTLVRGKLAKLVGEASAHEQLFQEQTTRFIEPKVKSSRQKPAPDASSSIPKKEANTTGNATLLFSAVTEEAGGDKTRLLNVRPIDVQDAKTVTYLDTHDAVKRQRDFSDDLAYLKVLKGTYENKKFHLPFGRTTIGRDPICSVALKDSRCSHVHSIIEYVDKGFILRDNNSTNGTFCNDSRVTEKMLEFGDQITIGDNTLLLTCEGYELKDIKPQEAILAFERCLEHQPEFLAALKNLAFLLERDIARSKEAQPLWDKIMKLEKRG